MCQNLTAISFIVLELRVTKVEKSDVCNCMEGFCKPGHICDWIWENVHSSHIRFSHSECHMVLKFSEKIEE